MGFRAGTDTREDKAGKGLVSLVELCNKLTFQCTDLC